MQLANIATQVVLVVQKDVECANIKPGQLKKMSGRVVDISEQGVWRVVFCVVVELVQKVFDSLVAVPSNYIWRNFVAESK